MKITPQSFEFGVKDIEEGAAFVKKLLLQRLPRNRSGKIGIIIALITENEEGRSRLEKDIVADLREYLSRSQLAELFNLMILESAQSASITDNRAAAKYLEKVGGHLLVWGSILERKINGKATYVCRLRGRVQHSPIPEAGVVQRELQDDFNRALPNRVLFPTDDEILGFDVTKEIIGTTTKFIIGCAALISKDYELSHVLFKELRTELESLPPVRLEHDPVISQVYARTKPRLVSTLHGRLDVLYYHYRATRDDKFIFATKPFIDELQKLEEDDYLGRTSSSIYFFKRGDIANAINQLKGIVGAPDTTWRYNLGFLYLCKGDIDEAMEHYRKAVQLPIHLQTADELDIFLSEQIDRGVPLTGTFVFFRALLNHKARGDNELAKKDFERFLTSPEAATHPQLKELADHYIRKIGDR